MTLTRILADILAPEVCLVCGMRGSIVCEGCARRLPPARTHISPWVFPRFDYQDKSVQTLMIHLKDHPVKSLARFCVEELAPLVVEELADRQMFGNWELTFLVVPIPIDRRRFIKHGFNQVELLGRELARALPGARYADILQKIKQTPKQALHTKRSHRLRGIAGAYEVKRTLQTTRSVIIIDDISTTGATLAEAKRALRTAGFKHIIGVSVAH